MDKLKQVVDAINSISSVRLHAQPEDNRPIYRATFHDLGIPLSIGRECWAFIGKDGSMREPDFRKITITHVRSGVCFFTFNEHPSEEHFFIEESYWCMNYVYPYVIKASELPSKSAIYTLDTLNGRIKIND